jgi:hypothetical protein
MCFPSGGFSKPGCREPIPKGWELPTRVTAYARLKQSFWKLLSGILSPPFGEFRNLPVWRGGGGVGLINNRGQEINKKCGKGRRGTQALFSKFGQGGVTAYRIPSPPHPNHHLSCSTQTLLLLPPTSHRTSSTNHTSLINSIILLKVSIKCMVQCTS